MFTNTTNSLKIVLLITLTILLFFAYFSPYLIKGKNSCILIHDNLDQINRFIFDKKCNSDFIRADNAEKYGLADNSSAINNIIPKIDKIFFSLFGYFWGFAANEFFYRLLSFIALYLLLKRLKGKSKFPDSLLILLSFSFASLPFWPQGNLSVAGIPIAILLFHNIYCNKYLIFSYIALFLYTFYSSLVLSGYALIIVLLIFIIYLFFKKKLKRNIILGTAILILGYSLTNYDLIVNQFFPTNSNLTTKSELQVSADTRSEMKRTERVKCGIVCGIKKTYSMFVAGQYHAYSKHTKVIIPSIFFLGIVLLFLKKFKYLKICIFLMLYIVISSIIYGQYHYYPVMKLYERLNFGFNYNRFYFLSPTFWYLIWAIVLINIYNLVVNKKWRVVFILLLILLQLGINFKSYTLSAWNNKPTFKQFVSEEQFDEIINNLSIDKQKSRIGCIGFFPSIANYNGLKTIGAYSSLYPVEFKHKFYEIIKDELSQNEGLKGYFLYWGSRAYLFDDKIGKSVGDYERIKKIENIKTDLNMQKLKKFGVDYLFSTVKISNYQEKNLEQILISNDSENYYKFFVYKIN